MTLVAFPALQQPLLPLARLETGNPQPIRRVDEIFRIWRAQGPCLFSSSKKVSHDQTDESALATLPATLNVHSIDTLVLPPNPLCGTELILTQLLASFVSLARDAAERAKS
jgi:hypothetical protein